MHELALTEDLVAVSLEHAGGRPIRRLVLEVGKLSGVLPDALRFAFEAIRTQTPALQETQLEILEPPGEARCRECGSEFGVESAWQACACGSVSLEWLAGECLSLKTMEVARV